MDLEECLREIDGYKREARYALSDVSSYEDSLYWGGLLQWTIWVGLGILFFRRGYRKLGGLIVVSSATIPLFMADWLDASSVFIGFVTALNITAIAITLRKRSPEFDEKRVRKEVTQEVTKEVIENLTNDYAEAGQERDKLKEELKGGKKEIQSLKGKLKRREEALKKKESEQRTNKAALKKERKVATKQLLKSVDDIPVSDFLTFFVEKLKVTKEGVKGQEHTDLLKVFEGVKGYCEQQKLVAPDRLMMVSEDVQRLNQIETIIDLYSEKIRHVKGDKQLDEEERELKIEYWQRLRDNDIASLEGSAE